MNLLQPMMVATLLAGGMGVALLGSLKLPLARRLEIDEARVGGLVSLFGFAMIPVILTAGFFTDRAGGAAETAVGRPMVLLAGSVLMAGSLGLLARAKSYAAALIAVLLLSAAWATLINVGNVLIQPAFGGTPAYAFNLANVFFGLGAFLTPLTVALLMRRTVFPVTVMVLAGVALVPGLLALGARDVAGEALGVDPGLAAIVREPMLWWCGLAMVFYGPLEASMAAWTTTYVSERGVAESTAAQLLSGFWLAFMASRLMAALALPDEAKELVIVVLAVCCIAVFAGMVVSRGRWAALILPLAAGLLFGPIFPTLMAVLLGYFPPAAHGRAVGIFFAVGGIGWTLLPILIGIYARRAGLQRAFLIAVGAAAGLSAVALVIYLRS